MGIQLTGDDNDEIVFEVKGKIRLALNRKGLYYRGELIKDAGEAYERFMEFLGIAEDNVKESAKAENIHIVKNPQQRLDQMREMKQVMAIVQRSRTGDDDGHWEDMMQGDVPLWVQELEPMTDMIQNGAKLQAQGGEYWYRAVTVAPEEQKAH